MNNLIFDIGMHIGQDTQNYLKDGYKVIAVEADPILAERGKVKFKKYIDSGQLVILNVGIAESEGILPFYRNHRLAEWSSFDKEMGSRRGTTYDVIDVQTTTTAKLFEKYGIPYYLKVDIEGLDYLCINDLPADNTRPKYVSCEANNIELLETLAAKGYSKFKIISQSDFHRPLSLKRERKPWYPNYLFIKNGILLRLQKIFPFRYMYGSTGPYGEKSKGKWISFQEAKRLFLGFYPPGSDQPLNKISWFDFHATF